MLEEVGFERLSTNMICKRAGLTPPALYRYFPNKYAVLKELGERRFQREAEVASRLDHPGICTVYETGEANGIPYIAMRYVEGQSLAHWLSASRDQHLPSLSLTFVDLDFDEKTELDLTEGDTPSTTGHTRDEVGAVVELMEGTARALHAAHSAGVIHRDIKPGNIMITTTGDPVILDFGLARALEDDHPTLTRSGDVFGTPAYMAPEQLRGNHHEIDARTDVWALGATLYECLALERPFDAPTREALYRAILDDEPVPLHKLNPRISRDLSVVVETALQKERNGRYQSADALAEDLRRVRTLEPIQASPVTRWIRAKRWAQRNPALAVTGALVLALLVAGLAGSLYHLRQTQRYADQLADESQEKSDALDRLGIALSEKDVALSARGSALRRAEAQRLAAEAEQVLDEDPALAKWLGLESLARLDQPVTRRLLYRALAADHNDGGAAPLRTGVSHLVCAKTQDWYAVASPHLKPKSVAEKVLEDMGMSPTKRPPIEIRRQDTHEVIKTLARRACALELLEKTRDEQRLVGCWEDGVVSVWSVPDGKVLHTIEPPAANRGPPSEARTLVGVRAYGGRCATGRLSRCAW